MDDTLAHNTVTLARSQFVRHSVAPRFAVLLLHPYGSTGRAMAVAGGWVRQSDVSICAPDALPMHVDQAPDPVRNAGIWSVETQLLEWRQLDDLAFIDACLDQFLNELAPDVPLFLVGHSNGGDMALRLLVLSRHRQRFRAAAVYAAIWGRVRGPIDRPLLYMAGRADRLRKEAGSVGLQLPWGELNSPPIAEVIGTCARLLGLSAPALAMTTADGSQQQSWRSEGAGAPWMEVELFSNQGHHWPHGSGPHVSWEPWLGPHDGRHDATRVARGFFERCLGSGASRGIAG